MSARAASNAMCRALLVLVAILGFSVPLIAQTETILYKFGNTSTDGFEPSAPLLIDSSGNLFGTTSAGGTAILCPDPSGLNSCGTVFELSKTSGNHTESVLYNFTGPPDGDEPTAGLISDSFGNLYGTTGFGGSNACGASSCGTVFELVKSATGYTEKVLYEFTGFEGANPLAGLVMDASGNLYGTAEGGGTNGFGVVFELVNSSGIYTEKVLYNFGATAADGTFPVGDLLMDSAGNLYGTTSLDAGPFSCDLTACGTVFELVKSANGYTEKILHTFSGSDGANPGAGLIADSLGNLFGTTSKGGMHDSGTVFELFNSSGNYTEKVLYDFGGTSSDGTNPVASLLMDASGNLFGTTTGGGSATACGGFGCGTVFELVNAAGSYTEKILHGFGGVGDGENPAAALVMDSAGLLYSTTVVGGSSLSLGTVFEINPAAPAPAVTLSVSSLSFDAVVSTSSVPQTVTVTNTGAANLIFGPSDVSLSGTNASQFTTSADTCSGQSIPPKATCSVDVTFTPTIAATETAALVFSDNAVVSVQQVSLTGLGLTPTASVSISPTRLIFGNQTVSTVSAAQPVTLMDTGGTALTITAISASAGFTETNNCGSSVASDASCVIEVSFSPALGGPQSGLLTVADNAPASPQSVFLLGTGISPNPVVTLSPGNLTFPAQMASTISAAQTVTLTNAGGASLSISRISASAGYSQTNNCGLSLAAGANCAINVSFAPTSGGLLSGTLSIVDSASGSPQLVTLSGTGEDFSVEPTSGSPLSVTVSPGATAKYSVNVAPLGGFNQTVTLACGGAPSLGSCSVSPTSASLDGTHTVVLTVSVTTTASTQIIRRGPKPPTSPPTILFILAGLFILWLVAGPRKTPSARLASLAIILLTVAIWISSGCGGNGSNPGSPGTPAGTYTLTVTGTSGNL